MMHLKTRIEWGSMHRLRARKKAQGVAALGIPSFLLSARVERVTDRLQVDTLAALALSTHQIGRMVGTVHR